MTHDDTVLEHHDEMPEKPEIKYVEVERREPVKHATWLKIIDMVLKLIVVPACVILWNMYVGIQNLANELGKLDDTVKHLIDKDIDAAIDRKMKPYERRMTIIEQREMADREDIKEIRSDMRRIEEKIMEKIK